MEQPIKDGKSRVFRVLYKNNPSFRIDESCPYFAEEDYTFVGRFRVVGLDDLFALLNNAAGTPNPLGSKEGQDYIRHHLLHTSMSVGDIAIDETDGRAYLVAPFGFKPVLKKALIYP